MLVCVWTNIEKVDCQFLPRGFALTVSKILFITPPLCLLALDSRWGRGLLALVWSLALCGVSLKIFWTGTPRWLCVVLYLCMGGAAVIAAPVLLRAVPRGRMVRLLAGGLVYGVGALAYGLKCPNPVPGVIGFHELWYLFVLVGSACHFWAVLRYVTSIA